MTKSEKDAIRAKVAEILSDVSQTPAINGLGRTHQLMQVLGFYYNEGEISIPPNHDLLGLYFAAFSEANRDGGDDTKRHERTERDELILELVIWAHVTGDISGPEAKLIRSMIANTTPATEDDARKRIKLWKLLFANNRRDLAEINRPQLAVI